MAVDYRLTDSTNHSISNPTSINPTTDKVLKASDFMLMVTIKHSISNPTSETYSCKF